MPIKSTMELLGGLALILLTVLVVSFCRPKVEVKLDESVESFTNQQRCFSGQTVFCHCDEPRSEDELAFCQENE